VTAHDTEIGKVFETIEKETRMKIVTFRFVPLALVLLGPIIVNIICFHVFMNPMGAPPAVVATILWFIVFYRNRQHFSGIFVQRS
jgi:sorbitol-specific phosphotransferase system component IIBC